MNDFQVLGSAITYIRRYALSSMLGIVTDKDTDASGEQVIQTESKPTAKTDTSIAPQAQTSVISILTGKGQKKKMPK